MNVLRGFQKIRRPLLDADVFDLNGREREQLGVVADDGLSLLTFDEEIETSDEGLAAGVCFNQIDRAKKRIVGGGNVILIRADELLGIYFIALADSHDIDIQPAEICQSTFLFGF